MNPYDQIMESLFTPEARANKKARRAAAAKGYTEGGFQENLIDAQNRMRESGPAAEAYGYEGLKNFDPGAAFKEYSGGAFGDFDEASGVARWTGTEWDVVGGGLGMYQTRGVVTDLVAHGEIVDATGCFNSAGGLDGSEDAVAALGIARWTGEAWQSLDDGSEGDRAVGLHGRPATAGCAGQGDG